MSDLDKTANTERTPVDVDELLRNIRHQFYTEAPLKKFLQDQNVLLLAVTWPAKWLKERGVTWSEQRYLQTLYDLLQQIKRHGATGEIQYFPGYLLKVIQDHFAHNGEDYCDEGKRARYAWEKALGTALGATRAAQIRADEQTLDTLAQAHRVLAIQRRRPKAKASPTDQLDLL
jgi:hypothetical protein